MSFLVKSALPRDAFFSFSLADFTGTAVAGADLPIDLVLSDFRQTSFRFVQLIDGRSWEARYNFTGLTLVDSQPSPMPLPATLTLLAFALLGFWWLHLLQSKR